MPNRCLPDLFSHGRIVSHRRYFCRSVSAFSPIVWAWDYLLFGGLTVFPDLKIFTLTALLAGTFPISALATAYVEICIAWRRMRAAALYE